MTTISEKIRKSQAWRDAERRCDFHAVVFFGTAHTVPRYIGESKSFSHNEHGWNVGVGLTTNIANYLSDIDRLQRDVEIIAYDHAYVMTREHGHRVLRHLDTMLLGDDNGNLLRNRWRWLDAEQAPQSVWPQLLGQALVDIELGGEYIETFDEAGKIDRIEREMRRRVLR